jgi:hypothetical protein
LAFGELGTLSGDFLGFASERGFLTVQALKVSDGNVVFLFSNLDLYDYIVAVCSCVFVVVSVFFGLFVAFGLLIFGVWTFVGLLSFGLFSVGLRLFFGSLFALLGWLLFGSVVTLLFGEASEECVGGVIEFEVARWFNSYVRWDSSHR